MTDSDLSLVQCTDEHEWDAFVSRSPQGSIFCQGAFLRVLPVRWERWHVISSTGRIQLGAVLLRDEAGRVIQQPYPFSLYHGVLLDQAVWGQPLHRAVSTSLRSVDFLLAELGRREQRISFCLHHTFRDLRSFSWFNYGLPEGGQWQVRVRYTGLVELGAASFDDYLAGIRKIRRSEYRRCQQAGFVVEPSDEVGAFIELYRQTFARQGIALEDTVVQLVWAITEAALARGFGELLVCRSAGGRAVSATLFLHDRACSYYLFGATDPEFRREGVGAYTLATAVRRSLERSISRIDMAGINSPARGDYKVSFNARPTPFYVVTWERVL